MSPTSDQLIDRRRMQRRLTLWRTLAFVGAAVALVVLGWRFTASRGGAAGLVPQIARVMIGGLITGDRDTVKLIDDLAGSRVAAVLVEIDSPGGTTAGSERIYAALRRLSAKKPTVCVVGTLAASGGYIAAIGTDHIIAQTTSLVGSIGVLFQFPNVSDALGRLGVKVETIKSSPLKASPNGLEPTTPEAKAAIDALVVDSYSWFKALVKQRRQLDEQQLAAVDDGRVFTGHQGLDLRLIDEVGEERDAVRYLETRRGVTKGLPIYDWKPSSGLNGLTLFSSASVVLKGLGFAAAAETIGQLGRMAEAQSLDGLMSIWQVR